MFCPAVRLISAFFIHAVFILLLLVTALAFGYFPKIGNVWLIYYVLSESIFLLVLGYLLSALTVFFKDIKYYFCFDSDWLLADPFVLELRQFNPLDQKFNFYYKPVSYISEGFRNAVPIWRNSGCMVHHLLLGISHCSRLFCKIYIRSVPQQFLRLYMIQMPYVMD